MSPKTKIIVGVIIVLVVLWLGYTISRGPAPTGTIKIGFIGPLTGEAAAYGEPERDAVAIAVDEINAAGGINGRKLEVIYEDGKCAGKDAASATQKLVNIDKVKMIIGGACSGEVFAMVPVTEPAKVIVLSPSASNPKIAEIGDYVFRNHPNDNDAGRQLAEVVFQTYKKVAVVSENTEYAQGLRQVFVDSFKKLGGEIVADESFVPETKDFRSIISKVKAADPEAIFINPQTGGAAARVAKQSRELGLKSQFYVAYLTGPEYVESDPAVEGTIFVDVPGLREDNPKAQNLLVAYRSRYGKEPNYGYFAGAAYDAVYLLTDAVKTVGVDTAKIRDYLYNLTSHQGVIGTYHFDRNGDVVGITLALRKIKNGRVVNLK